MMRRTTRWYLPGPLTTPGFRKVIVAIFLLLMTACAAKKSPPISSAIPSLPYPIQPLLKRVYITDPDQALKNVLDSGEKGNWDAVLILGKQIEEQYPNSAWYKRSLFLSERSFIQLDQPSQAQSAMLRIQAEYPEMADYAVFLLAEYAFSKGRYSEAAALYGVVGENYPKSSLLMKSEYQRGLALLGMFAYPQAVEAFTGFIEKYPHSELTSGAGLNLARALRADVKLEQAVRAYQNVWIKTPGTEADAETQQALAEMKTWGVEIPDYTADALYERGKNLARMGQHEKAVDAFKIILEENQALNYRADVLFRSGVELFNMNRLADSAVILEKVVHDYPDDPNATDALYWMGRCYKKLGDWEKGINAFQKLLDRSPDSEWADNALFLTADIYREEGDMKKAHLFYERLGREYPDSRFADSAIWWRAWLFYKDGDYKKTELMLQKLVDRYPRSLLVNQSHYWQGRAAEKMGDLSRAAACYDQVLKKGPYTFYGYLATERKRRLETVNAKLGASTSVNVEIEDICGGAPTSDELMNTVDADDGPPVWSEETWQVLFEEPSYRKILELMSLAMKKEAAQELWVIQGSVPQKRGNFIALSKAFFDLGDYYRSLQLVLRNYEPYLERPMQGTPEDLWLLAYPQGYWANIRSYAQKYSQDPFFIAAIVREESQFFPSAVSNAGARGLMQVMPTTGEWVAKRIKLAGFDRSKLFDADTGINIGTWYISYLMKQFRGDPLLTAAAYNAGPDAVSAWLAKVGPGGDRDAFVEDIPFAETRGYVKKVMRNYDEYRRIYRKTTGVASEDTLHSVENQALVEGERTVSCGHP